MVPDGLDADDFTIDLAVWETGDCRQPGAARLLWVQRHRWQTRFSPFLGVTEPLQVPHTRDMHRFADADRRASAAVGVAKGGLVMVFTNC